MADSTSTIYFFSKDASKMLFPFVLVTIAWLILKRTIVNLKNNNLYTHLDFTAVCLQLQLCPVAASQHKTKCLDIYNIPEKWVPFSGRKPGQILQPPTALLHGSVFCIIPHSVETLRLDNCFTFCLWTVGIVRVFAFSWYSQYWLLSNIWYRVDDLVVCK